MNLIDTPNARERLAGFTLVELLVTIVIVGILGSILLVSLPGILRRTDSTVAISNMREVSAAMILYANEHGGTYPPSESEKYPSNKDGVRI
ncbi:MAG: type II secretion system protein, partial [Puniceicoccales bacterium]